MTIEAAVIQHLLAHPGVAALVGDRIYPMRLPQRPTYPALTCQKVSGPRVTAKDGPAGLAQARMQVSCWAKSYPDAKAVAEQVRRALAGFSGVMGGAGGVKVEMTQLENEVDMYEPETGIYHVPVDFVIWHREE